MPTTHPPGCGPQSGHGTQWAWWGHHLPAGGGGGRGAPGKAPGDPAQGWAVPPLQGVTGLTACGSIFLISMKMGKKMRVCEALREPEGSSLAADKQKGGTQWPQRKQPGLIPSSVAEAGEGWPARGWAGGVAGPHPCWGR